MRRLAPLAPLAMLLGLTPAPTIANPAQAATPTTTDINDTSIADLAWISGHWRGEGFGGTCEEIWSDPLGETIMGCFKLVQNDAVEFYEMMVLGRDEEGFALKLKHFSSEFTAWETKEECVRFPLESIGENEAKFNGLEIKRVDDSLHIKLNMKTGAETRWIDFHFKRYNPHSDD